MADSTKGKNKKTLDAFADDLDAMLNTDDASESQKIGLIEDDDAIDKLLMGDSFLAPAGEDKADEFAADIDDLIANIPLTSKDQVEAKVEELDEFSDTSADSDMVKDVDEFSDAVSADVAGSEDFDEFGDDIDDLIANFPVSSKVQAEPKIEAIDEFSDTGADSQLVKDIDQFTDDFADQMVAASAETNSAETNKVLEENEGMKEIDEFSDVRQASDQVADFLMADFDISSGDDIAKSSGEPVMIDEFSDQEDIAETSLKTESETVAAEQLVPAAYLEEPVRTVTPAAASVQPAVDYGPQLAALTNQITVLKKQQQVFKQEMTEKSAKVELAECLEEIDKLQTEQKKTRRSLDALGSKKPVAAYVASGLAVTALLVGLGLGFQGYIAKSQIAELVPIIAKLQEQGGGTAAATDAADKEMLRKQLDELTVAGNVASSQIAEIKKALQGGEGSAGGDVGKQLSDLSNQNMQMGAAIESLQTKVSALEKNRPVAGAVAKPEKKKPPVIEQNWAVNLIAFKQDWYAKRKAEEFAAKGIPAKVARSDAKGETWYKLIVDGFKSEYEAAGYAARVKKTLNLDSVSVARINN